MKVYFFIPLHKCLLRSAQQDPPNLKNPGKKTKVSWGFNEHEGDFHTLFLKRLVKVSKNNKKGSSLVAFSYAAYVKESVNTLPKS